MDDWSARDERPYLRPEPRSYAWLLLLALALAAALAGFWYWYSREQPPKPAASVSPAPAPSATAPQAAPEPAIRHPLEAPPPEAAKALPTLDMSDAMMRQWLAELMGGKAFDDMVYPAQLVRRIVATIDNLPRRTAPRRMMPLNPVPGAFDAANSARYAPYVQAMEAVQPKALVSGYARAYPLFQRAYEELGYPGKYFNDRLVVAIDDLLAAPELDAPPALIRPKILYEFADPDLETRSAGQKIMIRIGRQNALKVKAKLREIRRELAAAGTRR